MAKHTAVLLAAVIGIALAFGLYRFVRVQTHPPAKAPAIAAPAPAAQPEVAEIPPPPPGFVLDKPVQLDPASLERINREAREREAVQEAIHTAVQRERRLQPEQ